MVLKCSQSCLLLLDSSSFLLSTCIYIVNSLSVINLLALLLITFQPTKLQHLLTYVFSFYSHEKESRLLLKMVIGLNLLILKYGFVASQSCSTDCWTFLSSYSPISLHKLKCSFAKTISSSLFTVLLSEPGILILYGLLYHQTLGIVCIWYEIICLILIFV
jgi:hypothetical protein